MNNKINSVDFYNNYFGHTYEHLKILHRELLSSSSSASSIVYLAGDSSLDNKKWVSGQEDATNGYETVLDPPRMKTDVAYHLNKLLEQSSSKVCINSAVEESTLSDRCNNGILVYVNDVFIQQNIRPSDTLIISAGGNDVVLKPSLRTVWNMLALVYLNPTDLVKRGSDACFGMRHIVNMFVDCLESYIRSLTRQVRPRHIIICSIYYPCEVAQGGWADRALSLLNYDRNSEHIRAIIDQVHFEVSGALTERLQMPSTTIIDFCALSSILDPRDPNDYVARVEPSDQGGYKMAKAFLEIINRYPVSI